IGKESNNLDESMIMGIDDNSYIEYENLEEFYNWVLKLKPKDVRDKGISERGLRNFKQKLRTGNAITNRSKIFFTLIENYSKLNKPD
ncbi:MAG: hypothetical protein QXS75_03665, partial [Thermoplasmatales archaeon]